MTLCNPLPSQQVTPEKRPNRVVTATTTSSQGDRVRALSNQIFPLTNPYINSQGQKIQLWSIPGLKPVGSITDSTGKVSVISPMRIRNPLNPNETPADLYMRLLFSPEDLQWTFSQSSDGSLTIWPRLKAAGWQDAIPISQDKFSRVNRLFRGKTQAEACEWFYNNGFKVITAGNISRIELFYPSDPCNVFVQEIKTEGASI